MILYMQILWLLKQKFIWMRIINKFSLTEQKNHSLNFIDPKGCPKFYHYPYYHKLSAVSETGYLILPCIYY